MHVSEIMRNKSPEERRAIAAKGCATRKKNLEERQKQHQIDVQYADDLCTQIAVLEDKLEALQRMETLHPVSAALTGRALLREHEIVAAARPWESATGVYFLVADDEVVYVGQSTNVYVRLSQHKDKQFIKYAFVPCDKAALDKLESLYIHCLRPRLNGKAWDGSKSAPVTLDALFKEIK